MALSRQTRTVFALTAPAYLWLAVTVLLPLATMLYFSFLTASPLGGKEVSFTLKHYTDFFTKQIYWYNAWRSIELGHVLFGPGLARTPAASEAVYLIARHAFEELGYRRFEWKCDALNAPSRRAALRYGFAFEGVFRRHMIVKGRSRDTAWYALTDADWPRVRRGFERWLDPANLDAAGHQRRRLEELRGA